MNFYAYNILYYMEHLDSAPCKSLYTNTMLNTMSRKRIYFFGSLQTERTMRGFDRTNWLLDLINQRPVRPPQVHYASSFKKYLSIQSEQ